MGVNLYTFMGARALTMAQIGTHNGFWAPRKIINAPTTVLPLGFYPLLPRDSFDNCKIWISTMVGCKNQHILGVIKTNHAKIAYGT